MKIKAVLLCIMLLGCGEHVAAENIPPKTKGTAYILKSNYITGQEMSTLIIEFTPMHDKNMSCILSYDGGGVYCYKKENKDND